MENKTNIDKNEIIKINDTDKFDNNSELNQNLNENSYSCESKSEI